MTVRELRWALLHPDVDQEAEVRVVYHGFERPSFNLPAASVHPGQSVGFLVIVEEART